MSDIQQGEFDDIFQIFEAIRNEPPKASRFDHLFEGRSCSVPVASSRISADAVATARRANLRLVVDNGGAA